MKWCPTLKASFGSLSATSHFQERTSPCRSWTLQRWCLGAAASPNIWSAALPLMMSISGSPGHGSEEGAITMTLFVGLDVSVKETAVCVVDDTGKVVCAQKVPTEPDDIVGLLASIGEDYGRIGIEAGPLLQWLVSGLIPAVRMIDSSPGRFPNRLEYDSLCVSRRFAGSATGWAGRSRSPVLSFRRRS